MFNDFNFYIRNRDGSLKYQINAIETANIIERVNDPGSWALRSRTKEQCHFDEGDGIIITKNGEFYYSGVLKDLQEEYDAYTGLYTWTAKGSGDLEFLTRRVCYPDPDTGAMDVVAYYEDTGLLGDVVKRVIDKNLGVDAMPSRQEQLLAETVAVDKGTDVSVSLRFEILLTAITRILESQGFNVRPEWDEVNKKIIYKIYQGADKSSIMVFSTAYNSILSTELEMKVPRGNFIILSGNGEPTEKEYVYSSDDDSIDKWGRVEYYRDRRLVEGDELQMDADIILKSYAEENIGYSSVLSNYDYQAQYKKRWNIGDYVAVFVHGKKYIQQVMQVETNLAYGEETITPTVGTLKQGQLMQIFNQLSELRADVDQLQGIGN